MTRATRKTQLSRFLAKTMAEDQPTYTKEQQQEFVQKYRDDIYKAYNQHIASKVDGDEWRDAAKKTTEFVYECFMDDRDDDELHL